MSEQVLVSREYLNNLLSCFQEGGDYGAHFALPDGVDSLELAEWCNTLYAELEAAALTAPAPAEAELRARLEGIASRWVDTAESTRWNLPDDITAAQCLLSEAQAQVECAAELREALKPEATP